MRFLQNTFDFTAWLKPHLCNIDGFASSPAQKTGGMHEFIFSRDAQGKAVMHHRQSSQASGWLPDGPGVRVFTTTPTGRPAPTPFRDSTSWKQDLVQANVERWMPYVAHQPEDQQRCSRVWTAYWPKGSVLDLKEEERLAFAPLPDQPPESVLANLARGEVPSSCVMDEKENPSVDPVGHSGRPNNIVHRERMVRHHRYPTRRDPAYTRRLRPR